MEHMLEDANDIASFVLEAASYDSFVKSRLYRKAIVMSLLNIGELTKQLPPEFKLEHNSIPWKKIAGMRDIAAHGYHQMDDEIIWDVAVNSIPDLSNFLYSQLHN